MSKIKYCYEFTEYRQYKCCECGRTMHKPTSHYCKGQLRKHNLKFTNMKQFNLEEYLKNPSIKVVTRDERNARIVCTDKKGRYPVVALVESDDNSERVFGFSIDGSYFIGLTDDKDLFFAPEKHEGWTNVYRGLVSGELYCANVYEREEFAKKAGEGSIATVKIEWEE